MQTFGDGNHTWNVEKLWEISEDFDVETVDLTVEENRIWYTNLLCEDCWSISPMEVFNAHLGAAPDHFFKAAEVDLSYPILLTPDGHVW